MKNVLIFAAAVSITLLSACATPTTGVVPRGEGLYTVTRQGEGFWVSTDQLKAQALVDAGSYCDSKKKPFKSVHSKETPAAAGRFPESEVLFKCE